MTTAAAASPWDLWTLRALDPTATEEDLARLAAARRLQAVWEERLFDRLLAGDEAPLVPGRRLLAARPELRSGLVLTVHLGPYQLVLEPFLAAGRTLHVLLNAPAARRLEPVAERLRGALHGRGRLIWHLAEDPACGRGLLRALRDGEPVLAFADGNQGRDGLVGTRERGIPYQLPGREIRVRTGLARLACRTGCAVHPLAVTWTDDGRSVVWRDQPSQCWRRTDDAVAVARRLYDWVFGEIVRAPAQWSYWPMLAESASCFAPSIVGREVPPSLHEDYRRAFLIALARAADTVSIELEGDVALWPGDLLVDLANDRFYAAEGLTTDDLVLLRTQPATLARLMAARGRRWVATHVLRLCLLGMAHLRGQVPVDAI
jgi:hypothetical protein